MKAIRIIFILCLLTIISKEVNSQSGYKACYGFDCKQKKWSVSVFGGFSLLGPGQKINDQMIASGFGDEGISFDPIIIITTTDYPFRSAGTSWNVSVGYDISKKFGLQLTGGNNFSYVEGYDDIGLGNSLLIKNSIWTASINCIYKLRKGKDGIHLGPVMANYSTKADNLQVDNNQVIRTSTLKAGFNAGYTFSLIQKKSWFLAANVNYTWLPDSEVGPYTVAHSTNYPPEDHISTFDKTDVGLSHISFGISTGFKF